MNKYSYEITKTIHVEIEAEDLAEAFDQMHVRLENEEFDNFFLHSHPQKQPQAASHNGKL